MTSSFPDRLIDAIERKNTPAIVGIDPVLERLPAAMKPTSTDVRDAVGAIERFSREVIELVAASVPAVKINSAFFEAFYDLGVAAYYRLVKHAHERGLLVIGDIKRGDIGSTARLYARGHLAPPVLSGFDPASIPDAVTVSGYLGEPGVKTFIDVAANEGRGIFVLVRPSDPGADHFHEFGDRTHFYQHLAEAVHAWGAPPELRGESGYSCVGAVVAAKDTQSTTALRKQMPHTLFLVPGYGAQGATVDAIRPCFHRDGKGAIVNASRSVIYAYEDRGRAQASRGDWQACIAAACARFAVEVARAAGGTEA